MSLQICDDSQQYLDHSFLWISTVLSNVHIETFGIETTNGSKASKVVLLLACIYMYISSCIYVNILSMLDLCQILAGITVTFEACLRPRVLSRSTSVPQRCHSGKCAIGDHRGKAFPKNNIEQLQRPSCVCGQPQIQRVILAAFLFLAYHLYKTHYFAELSCRCLNLRGRGSVLTLANLGPARVQSKETKAFSIRA